MSYIKILEVSQNGKQYKTRENRVRRQLARQGLRLQKSRTNGSVYVNGVYQGENVDDRGGYRIVDASTNAVVTGERFDMSLEDVERWAAEEAKNNLESELAERAEEFDMDLRQDSDGFYWLDFVNQPDMRSLGPMDLDEVADRITAAENGFSGNQVEDYMANLED